METKPFTLSLIIPCYNEEHTIEKCVDKVRAITDGRDFALEIVIVNDCSTDGSADRLAEIAKKYPDIKIFTHEKNRGKGAALRTGLMAATGDYVGIQDADDEYDPREYHEMLKPVIEGRADVVFGSRYLLPNTRRVLYFWHTWMNRALTAVSNMFTNLDITDMETCYKLFRREVIQDIAPKLKEDRFGFEPEVTVRVAQSNCRVYECAISYNPRSYEEGKKIGWKDGVRALYCLLHYGAHSAPLPMQLLIYLFIGGSALVVNMLCFIGMTQASIPREYATVTSFIISALCNYLLCVAILFRHKARWNTLMELFWYVLSVSIMGVFDFVMTEFLIAAVPIFTYHWSGAKLIASVIGFIGNFALRKVLVFPERRRGA